MNLAERLRVEADAAQALLEQRDALLDAARQGLDVELIRKVTSGWYGSGASGEDWDRFMVMLRDYADAAQQREGAG